MIFDIETQAIHKFYDGYGQISYLIFPKWPKLQFFVYLFASIIGFEHDPLFILSKI